ncbi:hypothetical protein UFOVP1158_11 [uncultured Caudovirales phage]|uniref:Uncharacterized protein n=1 Tax=uncultured Caudovirales phage TaxID=2100421 RepID=A0A6J5R1J8_9CAUD|nr:hypothetical protein UFOVP1158_11 [uncultured Caudovirales phage]
MGVNDAEHDLVCFFFVTCGVHDAAPHGAVETGRVDGFNDCVHVFPALVVRNKISKAITP